MMLSKVISVPTQLVNDVDVYLSPLIEDLRVLSHEGFDLDDTYSSEKFKMSTVLFFTINDFYTYGNLYVYNIKGHKACSICESNTCSHQLQMKKDCLPWAS